MTLGTIDNLYVLKFKKGFELLSQQKISKLEAKVTVKTGNYGERAAQIDQIAARTPAERTTAFSDTVLTASQVDRRWAAPKFYNDAVSIDSIEQLQLLESPKNMYTEAMVAGFKRLVDDVIIAAFFGTNLTGKQGTDSTVFDTNQVIANTVGSTTGMNLAKIEAGVTLLKENDVDLDAEMPVIVMSPAEEAALIKEETVASADYNRQYVVENGKLARIYGCEVVLSNRLPEAGGAGTDRQCMLFVKSGLCLAIWDDMKARITERDDKNYATQLWMEKVIGATRLQEKKCVSIECVEA